MPVTVTCQQCGAAFDVPPSRVKRRRFCSHECRHRWMSESQRGKAHPMYGRRHTPESIRKMSESQKANGRTGPRSPAWKGGRFKMRGYWMVSLSILSTADTALALPMMSKGREYLPEHRLVMARMLGRSLTKDEVVHHRNGIKTDNHSENLELHNQETHTREHAALYRELRELRALAEKCSCGTFPRAG